MAVETLFGGPINFTMAYAGKLIVRLEGQHGYNGTALPATWGMTILLDGNPVRSSGGSGAVTENPFCGIPIFNVAAGNHTITFQWFAKDNTMTLKNVSAYIDRRYG